jgi:hypothetical protein
VRVAAGVLIALPFALLPVLWALAVIPLGGLLPLLTAPLAIRLGERASHRSGATLGEIRREALIYLAGLVVLLLLGLSVSVGGS